MARTREKTSSTMFSSIPDIAPCLSSVTEQAMNKIMTKISNHVRNIDKTEPELLESHPRHLGDSFNETVRLYGRTCDLVIQRPFFSHFIEKNKTIFEHDFSLPIVDV